MANYRNEATQNIDSKVYKWNGTSFIEYQTIQTHGAFGWESFTIDGETYLAVANLYNNTTRNIDSKIYKWNGISFVEIQPIPTNGALDWESFQINGGNYLAGANYYNDENYNINSRSYRWNGATFQLVQSIFTSGCFDWESFEIDGEIYLAAANYYNGSTRIIDSKIYKVTQKSLADSLVAFYPFNGTAEDGSTSYHHGTANGDLTYEPAVNGLGAKFDGIDDFVDVVNAPEFNGNEITISAWIKPEDANRSTDMVLNKENQYEFAVINTAVHDVDQLGELAIAVNPNWYWYGSDFSTPLNQYTHVAMVFDSNHFARIYANGVFQKEITYTGGIQPKDSCIRIGARGCISGGTLSAYFKGVIDDLRIYNRSLTGGEINALYNLDSGDLDSDGDSVLDDGDHSGIVGDAPCTGGNTTNCDDNCSGEPNADQSDTDGDGIGDVCEQIIYDTVISEDTVISADDLDYENTSFTVDGSTVNIDGAHAFVSISLINGAVLTHSNNITTQTNILELTIEGDLTIEAGSQIDVNGKGYISQQGPGAGDSYVNYAYTGGGGGYGAVGGKTQQNIKGGAAYGSITEPVDIGSGGGNAHPSYKGGAGGGAIRLDVAGRLQIDGIIVSNGYGGAVSGSRQAGGGSGGSIYLTVGTISGNGEIRANGGSGHDYGGGGSGGRIAIYHYATHPYSFDPANITVEGGSGYQNGENGTIYMAMVANPWITTNNGFDFVTADPNLVLEGTCLSNIAAILVNGSQAGVVHTSGDTAWSYTVVLQEGLNAFDVYAEDAGGNRSGTSRIVITLDTTPAGAPVITTNTGGDLTVRQSHFVLEGTCAGDVTAILVNGSEDGVSYTPGSGVWSFGTELDIGENDFGVTGLDEASNESPADTIKITFENTPPDLPVNLSPADGESGMLPQVTLTASDFADGDAGDTQAASQWQVRSENGDYDSPIFDSGADAANLTEITIAFGALELDSNYYWRVRYRDSRGSWTAYSDETGLATLLDSEPPETQIISGPAEGGKIFVDNTAFGWTGSDNVQWNLTYATKLDDNPWTDFSAVATIAYTGLGDGPHTFRVKARDHAGNEDPSPAVRTFYVHVAPEDVTDLAVESFADRLLFSWTPSVDTIGDLAGYRIYFDGIVGPVDLGPAAIDWEATDLDPSTAYEFRITVLDTIANESPGVSTTGVTVMPNPADLVADPFIAGVNLSWSGATPSEYVKHYRIFMSESEFSSVDGATPYLISSSTSASISNLNPGSVYYFAVTTLNLSGGEQKTVNTVSAQPLVDTIPPNTTITSGPAEDTYTSATSVTFNWSGSDNLPGALSYSFRLDSAGWSPFDPLTSITFENLNEGSHTFSVKAKDLAGNEDLSPAVRNFTVDLTPPEPATDLKGTSSQSGVKLDWLHSPSSDIKLYRLYWDGGSGTIDYSQPFASIYYPSKSYYVSFQDVGTRKFGLRSVDKAGNEEQNTSLQTAVTISEFNISIEVQGTDFERGQEVPITGILTSIDNNPLVYIPVVVDVIQNGYHRKFTSYTNSAGEYRYNFQPRSNEAGNYMVVAYAMYEGLEKTVSSSFAILGLYLQPTSVTVDMSMNSAKTVNLSLKNIGSTDLTDIVYNLTDVNPDDLVAGTINPAGLPTSLAADGSIGIPVVINANQGEPPTSPAIFTLNVASSGGSEEVSVIAARLHEAVSIPVVTPDPLTVGVYPEEPATKMVTVSNKGYAPMQNTLISVHDPVIFDWISVVNGELGTIGPSEAKISQIYVNPSAEVTQGNYIIQLNLSYDGGAIPFYMAVEVTTADTGQVAFKVHDDTGSVVPNTEVSLVSKEFYVNVTPQGEQEYNNVINGTTDSEGYVLFEDVPEGEYRYIISAVDHDSDESEITIEPGTTPQTIGVILVTNLVDVEFSVTPTTIEDQYTVTLNITYTKVLTKPTLYANPSGINLSFFPEDCPEPDRICDGGTITLTNTSNNAPVRALFLDASAIEGVNIKFHCCPVNN